MTYSSRDSASGLGNLEKLVEDAKDEREKNLFGFGVCDVSNKIGQFIDQRYRNTSDLTKKLEPIYKKNQELHHSDEENFDFGILDIPPVFTKEWKRKKDDSHWEAIDGQDLLQQIDALNADIKTVN